MIAKSLASGKLVYPGPLDLPHAWAYLPDLARAFVAVAAPASELPAFADLHFAGHTLTGTQLLAAWSAPPPAWAWRRRAGSRHGAHALGPDPRRRRVRADVARASPSMSYLWRVPHALDGTALHGRRRRMPATPIDAALRAALLDLGFGAEPQPRAAAAA